MIDSGSGEEDEFNGSIKDRELIIEDIVIDYSLPVKIKLPKYGTTKISSEKSHASYGDLIIDGDNTTGDWSVTYKLNQMLEDVDTVYLVFEDNTECTFKIIPATTMYYEENSGFITYTGTGWQSDLLVESKYQNEIQETNIVGNAKMNPYGSDNAYNNDIHDSNGTSKFGNTTDKAIRFVYEFTGTGTSFFARASANTGYVQIKLYSVSEDGTETLEEISYRDVYFDNTNVSTDILYNIPIYTASNLNYGKYKVQATVAKAGTSVSRGGSGNEFYLDGIRVYNPVKGNTDAEAAYLEDCEAYPELKEIRDLILEAGSLSGTDRIQGAVFVDNIGETPSIADYEDLGPSNELYLAKGQAVSFSISNAEYEKLNKICLGVKSPTGSKASINVSTLGESGKIISTNSANDMFYDIRDCISFKDDGTSKILVIKNTGSDLVSITNLKCTYKESTNINTSFLTSTDDANSVLEVLK